MTKGLSANNGNIHNRAGSSSSVKLIIFDKDGTLIDFHGIWVPWAKAIVRLIEEHTGLACADALYETLGFCPITNRVSMGALAEKAVVGIRQDVSQTIQKLGVHPLRAEELVHIAIPEAVPEGICKPVVDLIPMFEELKQLGVRIAVCTADNRTATMSHLNTIGVTEYIDMIVCGNDPGVVHKPSPHCAIEICKRFGLELSEAVMVGDTVADVKMGRVAGLRASVAVLSGVGTKDTLEEYSDVFLDDVSHIPNLVRKLNAETVRA